MLKHTISQWQSFIDIKRTNISQVWSLILILVTPSSLGVDSGNNRRKVDGPIEVKSVSFIFFISFINTECKGDL